MDGLPLKTGIFAAPLMVASVWEAMVDVDIIEASGGIIGADGNNNGTEGTGMDGVASKRLLAVAELEDLVKRLIGCFDCERVVTINARNQRILSMQDRQFFELNCF